MVRIGIITCANMTNDLACSSVGCLEDTRYAVEKVGVNQDDVTLMMYAIPLESMSFGGGKLVSDIDLSMPWVNK